MFWFGDCETIPANQDAFGVLSNLLAPFEQLVADSSKVRLQVICGLMEHIEQSSWEMLITS